MTGSDVHGDRLSIQCAISPGQEQGQFASLKPAPSSASQSHEVAPGTTRMENVSLRLPAGQGLPSLS
ncbi:hypothetical protein P7K49_011964, partial [Saguinus oedipus]